MNLPSLAQLQQALASLQAALAPQRQALAAMASLTEDQEAWLDGEGNAVDEQKMVMELGSNRPGPRH